MKLGKLLSLALLSPAAGCLSAPPADNPMIVRPSAGEVENPVLIRPGQPSETAYAEVFEKVLNVVDDYFVIAYSNRYDGRIIGRPKIAPGIGRFWVNGSTDWYQRWLATFQTVRYRCFVQIRSAEQGGYLVQVTVFRELKDERRPTNGSNVSVFRDSATVDRQFVVVDPDVSADVNWIPNGRDSEVEDSILKKIRRCQFE